MRTCGNCGASVSDGAAFCGQCGQPLAQTGSAFEDGPQDQIAPFDKPAVVVGGSGAISLAADGKHRWVYEYNLLTNPGILLYVLKVFVGIALGIFIAMGIFDFIDTGRLPTGDELSENLRFYGILLAIFVGLALVGYLVYALIMGGKYCVLFTMDEECVEHRQLPREFKKAQVVGALNVLVGLASGNVSQVGIGLMTAGSESRTTEFPRVRTLKGSRLMRTIKVNETLVKNQVFVDKEDYDYVFGFIRDHCPNAKKVRG